eukprot:TRINITY_DN65561_c0_g1_i1.p1 TRINITY_DN65561_c0_g1~~TRINITY_DN65561_c0_g1_i1.p1  ORF type:complete len:792 (+),score=166.47 TRINITY_DN65561_c0_g1_i1:64-2376(+)
MRGASSAGAWLAPHLAASRPAGGALQRCRVRRRRCAAARRGPSVAAAAALINPEEAERRARHAALVSARRELVNADDAAKIAGSLAPGWEWAQWPYLSEDLGFFDYQHHSHLRPGDRGYIQHVRKLGFDTGKLARLCDWFADDPEKLRRASCSEVVDLLMRFALWFTSPRDPQSAELAAVAALQLCQILPEERNPGVVLGKCAYAAAATSAIYADAARRGTVRTDHALTVSAACRELLRAVLARCLADPAALRGLSATACAACLFSMACFGEGGGAAEYALLERLEESDCYLSGSASAVILLLRTRRLLPSAGGDQRIDLAVDRMLDAAQWDAITGQLPDLLWTLSASGVEPPAEFLDQALNYIKKVLRQERQGEGIDFFGRPDQRASRLRDPRETQFAAQNMRKVMTACALLGLGRQEPPSAAPSAGLICQLLRVSRTKAPRGRHTEAAGRRQLAGELATLLVAAAVALHGAPAAALSSAAAEAVELLPQLAAGGLPPGELAQVCAALACLGASAAGEACAELCAAAGDAAAWLPSAQERAALLWALACMGAPQSATDHAAAALGEMLYQLPADSFGTLVAATKKLGSLPAPVRDAVAALSADADAPAHFCAALLQFTAAVRAGDAVNRDALQRSVEQGIHTLSAQEAVGAWHALACSLRRPASGPGTVQQWCAHVIPVVYGLGKADLVLAVNAAAAEVRSLRAVSDGGGPAAGDGKQKAIAAAQRLAAEVANALRRKTKLDPQSLAVTMSALRSLGVSSGGLPGADAT